MSSADVKNFGFIQECTVSPFSYLTCSTKSNGNVSKCCLKATTRIIASVVKFQCSTKMETLLFTCMGLFNNRLIWTIPSEIWTSNEISTQLLKDAWKHSKVKNLAKVGKNLLQKALSELYACQCCRFPIVGDDHIYPLYCVLVGICTELQILLRYPNEVT